MSRRSEPLKPITPRVHGLIDYGFAVGNLVLPTLLKTAPATRGVFAAFGVIQGALNAFTAQPYAVDKVVPFKLHGLVERNSLGLYVAAPLLAGILVDRRGRWLWLAVGAALAIVYNLTDWDAKRTGR